MHPMLNIAVRAARAAGTFVAKSFEQPEKIEAQVKGTNDWVTNIDKEAERLIIDTIKKSYPDHAFVGEEGGAQGESDYQWVIDPLDGTTNFLRGIPHFCVSIALRVKGKTEQAVVFDPIRGEIFTASRGMGAQLNGKRLRVSAVKELNGTILATGLPFKQRQHYNSYMALFTAIFEKAADVRRSGSAALDLSYLAAGRIDGFFELGLKPWDIAAGELIAREAGAIVTDFSGGHDYFKSGNIVAAPARMLPALLGTIKPLLTDAIAK
ncbi:inositol-1-monophosphatase [Gallaecimonas pentaromativorans]|uniref:Inositol-1-monophosphatase n=1 Tax=Gallaecimonas pentaromativorans TaxID=584787 RepID=A0A3N1PNV9_9GAMM|nr:inositol-1-monophosphatase [Gallaecimonas pentaromativorans]MED5524667.1 inositol-1-monophosphatase [Pseudomonadota bacterium]ROQ28657.1 myo-inositol-1(or 4)-monophosphatase [Gallaecimonas pentaromativorans]